MTKVVIAGEGVTAPDEKFQGARVPDIGLELTATLEPPDVNATWKWRNGTTDIDGATDAKYTLPGEPAGTGPVVLTAVANCADKSEVAAAITLTTPPAAKDQETPAGAAQVVEVSVGEYDPTFAVVSGAVIAVVTLIGLILIAMSTDFGTLTGDDAVPYNQRLLAGTAVCMFGAGIVAAGIGTWLAALEVRGRLRKPDGHASVTVRTTLSQPAGFNSLADGSASAGEELAAASTDTVTTALEQAPKVLAAAGNIRGTIAVMLIAAALIFSSTALVFRVTPTPTPAADDGSAATGGTGTDTPATGAGASSPTAGDKTSTGSESGGN